MSQSKGGHTHLGTHQAGGDQPAACCSSWGCRELLRRQVAPRERGIDRIGVANLPAARWPAQGPRAPGLRPTQLCGRGGCGPRSVCCEQSWWPLPSYSRSLVWYARVRPAPVAFRGCWRAGAAWSCFSTPCTGGGVCPSDNEMFWLLLCCASCLPWLALAVGKGAHASVLLTD